MPGKGFARDVCSEPGMDAAVRAYKRPGLSCHTAQVSAVAKVIQPRYGARHHAASGRTRLKYHVVTATAIHNRMISPNAIAPRRHAKKSHVQSALSTSCPMNNVSPRCRLTRSAGV